MVGDVEGLGKTETSDDPITYLNIIELLEKDLISVKETFKYGKNKPKYNEILRRCILKFSKEKSNLMLDPRSLKALDVAEAYINGLATKEELKAAKDSAFSAYITCFADSRSLVVSSCSAYNAYTTIRAIYFSNTNNATFLALEYTFHGITKVRMIEILKEIFEKMVS